MERQRDVVAAICKNLEKSLGDMQAWIARLTETNQAMAGRIAKLQLEAAQRIDQRTREMALSGTGRLLRPVGIYDRDYYRQTQRSGFPAIFPRDRRRHADRHQCRRLDHRSLTLVDDGNRAERAALQAHWLSDVLAVHVGPPALDGLWLHPLPPTR